MIVAIDGPAGTGKSSVGRALARRLGVEFLDTGAMYRAATTAALEEGVDLDDADAVARAVREADLRFDWSADPPAPMAHGRPIGHRLRDEDVARAISRVSAMAAVRQVLVEAQRKIGREHPRLVTEGRDQGSVVFPHADVKIYLDASARVRARRRAAQMGGEADIDAIERELIERDRADSSRPVGPLIRPDDAVVVDTTDLDFDAVINRLERIVRDALAERSGSRAE